MFPEGERDLPNRLLSDKEVANKRRLARLQYFAYLEKQTFKASQLLTKVYLPF